MNEKTKDLFDADLPTELEQAWKRYVGNAVASGHELRLLRHAFACGWRAAQKAAASSEVK